MDKHIFEEYEQHPTVSALLLLYPSVLGELESLNILPSGDMKSLKAAARQQKSFLYSFRRSPSAMAYVIVAETPERALELLKKISEMKTGFTGVYSGS